MSRYSERPAAALSRNGRRLNLRHGPIDLIVVANGTASEVRRAYGQAAAAFETVLPELAAELSLLRKPVSAGGTVPDGSIAGRMHQAAMAHRECFVTPMVAVAGAVADHILGHVTRGRDLRRASVNNGGDIALYLGPGSTYEIGICANPQTGQLAGTITITEADPVRGLATSGWRGRSCSLGIADAVTVLAADSVSADAAATMIANEVTIEDSHHVQRQPASELYPDSDLGDRLVTVAVQGLTRHEVDRALDRGERAADAMARRGLIIGAFLCLDGEVRTVGSKQIALGASYENHLQPPITPDYAHA